MLLLRRGGGGGQPYPSGALNPELHFSLNFQCEPQTAGTLGDKIPKKTHSRTVKLVQRKESQSSNELGVVKDLRAQEQTAKGFRPRPVTFLWNYFSLQDPIHILRRFCDDFQGSIDSSMIPLTMSWINKKKKKLKTRWCLRVKPRGYRRDYSKIWKPINYVILSGPQDLLHQ